MRSTERDRAGSELEVGAPPEEAVVDLLLVLPAPRLLELLRARLLLERSELGEAVLAGRLEVPLERLAP